MNNWVLPLLAATALCVLLFGSAFVVAPHSCEWGLTAYCAFGAAVVVVLVVMPFLADATPVLWPRILVSLCLGFAGALVWAGGLIASNMRIVCRLF